MSGKHVSHRIQMAAHIKFLAEIEKIAQQKHKTISETEDLKLVYDCSLGGGGCDHICRCDGCSYNIIREHTINEAPTIIEADKGE